MTREPIAVRLNLGFDAAALLADADRPQPGDWLLHFNTSNYSGNWSGVVFRGPSAAYGIAPTSAIADDPVLDHPLLAACPAVAAALRAFECPILSARFLRLEPGAVIQEHRDDDLVPGLGKARIHIPVQTNPEVEFIVAGRRIKLLPGECWYLDLSHPHRVQNLGATTRIHLVIDCDRNDWLQSLILTGDAPTDRFSDPAPGWVAFRQQIWDSPALLEQIQSLPSDPHPWQAIVALGASHGYRFTAADLDATARTHRQRWNQKCL